MEVLIVDDNTMHASWLTEVIKEEGHTSFWAASGTSARELLIPRSFDLVLLDVFLPDIKGYELMPEFVQAWPGVHIIVMTGYSTKELEVEVRRRGAIYYFIKPIDIDELTGIIRHLAGKRKLKHQGGL